MLLRHGTFGMTLKCLDFISQKWGVISFPKVFLRSTILLIEGEHRLSSTLVKKNLEVRGFSID